MPLLNLLLPICDEMEVDVFLLILRSIIDRKNEEHFLVRALKFGMTGEKLTFEEEDLNLSWRCASSKQERIRQSYLLGVWSSRNFPSLGKRFHGLTWAPSQLDNVVLNNQTISAQEISAKIAAKLRLRVLQVNLSNGTLCRLTDFVEVPASIRTNHETQLSKQMKMFEIDGEYLDDCWEALKYGQFSVIADERIGPQILPTSTNQQHEELPMDIEHDARSTLTPNSNLSGEHSTGQQFWSAYARSVLAPQTNGNSADSIHAALLNIRNDIAQLSKLFITSGTGTSEGIAGSNLVDRRLADATAYIDELRHELANCKKRADDTTDELKQQIAELEKEKIASANLFDRGIADTNAYIDKLRYQLADSEKRADDTSAAFKQQIADLEKEKIDTANLFDRRIADATAYTDNLRHEIADCRKRADDMSAEFKQQIVELQGTNFAIQTEAAESLQKMGSELKGLRDERQELYDKVAGLKSSSNQLSTQLQNEMKELATSVAQTEGINAGLSRDNLKLRGELAIKEEELNHLRRSLSELQKPIQMQMGTQTETPTKDMPYEDDIEMYDQSNNGYASVHDGVTEPVCVTEEDIIERCRPVLIQQKFGWMKFQKFKSCKYRPGFVYAADADGKERAQLIKADGFLTSTKNIFFEFHDDLPEEEKLDAEKLALRKFNEKFRFSFK